MHALLVNEDLFYIASLKRDLPWADAGVQKVSLAGSLDEGLSIIEKEDIDLVIADIIFEGTDVFDRMKTFVGREDLPPVIVLTSTSDITYAQTAIRLGAVDYIVRSADPEELLSAVRRAAELVQKRNTQEMRTYREFWMRMFSLYRESSSKVPEVPEQFYSPYPEGTILLPVIFTFYPYYLADSSRTLASHFETYTFDDMLDAWRSTMGPYLRKGDLLLRLRQDNRFLGVLQVADDTPLDKIREALDTFLSVVYVHSRCPGRGFIGAPGLIERIPEHFREIVDVISMDSREKPRLVDVPSFRPPRADFELIDSGKAVELLTTGSFAAFAEYIHEYLQRLQESRTLSRAALEKLRINFEQELFILLRQQGILADAFTHNENFRQLSIMSTECPRYMEMFMQYTITAVRSMLGSDEFQESIPQRIVRYVNEHYAEDISRNTLEEVFFLDSGYASRLFRNEIGVSFMDYVINVRIRAAKQLLAGTSMPVSNISFSVGYTNYAYFTRLFRKKTGESPTEYRERVRSGQAVAGQISTDT